MRNLVIVRLVRKMSKTEVEVSQLPGCDICGTLNAHYDGKTIMGAWAYMCSRCFKEVGVGLGVGRGQRLVKRRR